MNMLQQLCTLCVTRMNGGSHKGKRRDADALEFMAGAAMALVATQHPEADHVCQCVGFIIAPRGYREIERIANEAQKEVAL